MERTSYAKLVDWKKNINRKPLLVQGARQVGKTYLVKQFGEKEYENNLYLNFEQEPELKTLFESSLHPDKIIENISLFFGKKVIANNTLIFFDEIQVAPNVLSSLKYFQEQAPHYHIIAAGSLLGVSIDKKTSFPVGKVNFLNLYPMSFIEYLLAIEEVELAGKLRELSPVIKLPEPIHNKLIGLVKKYLFLGGMPEVLESYINDRDIENARKLQYEILEAYKRDFSKYTEKNEAIRISEFWQSIPYQLAKENKKFKYRDIAKNARANKYEGTIEWLRKAGLINVVKNIATPKIPLSGYADGTKFKVYLHDVGLLAAELGLTSDLIVKPNEIFTEYKGAFIENFVAQELNYYGFEQLYYWTSRSDAEVDFIINDRNTIKPIEVKSGLNKNMKSIRSYANKYQPQHVVRISPRNFEQINDFINLPFYAINLVNNI